MLYDPKWEVKTDPFTLESLIAWLERQPADSEYDFQNCNGLCLLGQYMASVGIDWSWAAYTNFRNAFVQYSEVARAPIFRIGAAKPWTFGAALERARLALKP